jgi:hypothetical protein
MNCQEPKLCRKRMRLIFKAALRIIADMYIATGKDGGLGGRVLPQYVVHFGVRPHNRGHAV